MKELLVAVSMTAEQRALLVQQLPDARYTYLEGALPTDEQLARANIILGCLPPDCIRRAGNLEWFQTNSSGADLYM